MSATEIINELPKLTEKERRAVGAKLLELAAEKQNINLSNDGVINPKTKTVGKRITSLPDFRARVKKIFPRPIPKKVADMADRLIAGE